jgi:hypothetical protein
VDTATYSTPAPVHFAVARARVSNWASQVQGTNVSTPAFQLGRIAGMTTATCTTPANAAKGATRKDASGGEAFEDPV